MSVNLSDETWPASVDPELAARIVDVIVKEGMLERASMRPGVTLDELNFDSLEAVMVLNGIEDAFDVEIGSDFQWGDARDLSDLVALLADAIKRSPRSLQS